MSHRTKRIGFFLALASVAWSPLTKAQQDANYKPVDAQHLRDNLPKYWATGLAFVDTVMAPLSADSQRMGTKTYVKFETKLAGTCYADTTLGSRLQELQPGKDFVFTAMVLQRERGLFAFGKESQYFVAVLNIQPALGNAANIPDQLASLTLPTNSSDRLMLANLSALLKNLQTDLALVARERGVKPWELLDPSSTNRSAAEMLITSGVNSLASEMKVQPQDILGQVLMALMSANVQPAAVPAPEPAPEPTPGAGQEMAVPLTAPDQAAAEKVRLAQEKQARQEAERAAEQEKERLAAEQAAQVKKAKAEKAQKERDLAAKEKSDRLEAERLAAEKAAQEEAAVAEAARLKLEQANAEKKALAEQAKAEKLRMEQEMKAQAETAARLAAEAEAMRKANAEADAAAASRAEAQRPKLRVSTVVEAVRVDPPAEPKAVQPSAKIQPTPPVPTPPVPAEDDLNAPVPF
jgi:hypothetical protein